MDEPLAALDAPRKAEILPFLQRLRDVARVPILYVTHALDEVDRLADTLVLMEAGRIAACDTVEALSARTDLRALTSRRDAGAALPCTIDGHDPARGLTRLAFPGGTLLVPLRPEPPGTALRLRLRARDVSLALEKPHGISVQNILRAELVALDPVGPHELFATVKVGPSRLFARITRDAAAVLALRPGMPLFALVKSAAFDHGP